MRKVGLWLAALLVGAGLIFIVLKQDVSVPKPAASLRAKPLEVPAALRNPPMLNWTNAAARFAHATEVSRVLTNAATNRVMIEVVKTRSKYPFIRVETPFRFDPQAQAWVPQASIEYVADQVLVELKPGVTDITNALARVEGRIIQTHTAGDSTLVLVGLPTPEIEAVPRAINQLTKFSGLFSVVEPHLIRRASRTPNDPRFYEQWALQNIQAEAAWDIQRGHYSVVVAVVDSGLDFNHPELSARVWSNPGETANNFYDDDRNGYVDDHRGYNFAYNNNNPFDDLDHGTFVSGLLGAAGNNGLGTAGICWDLRIMPLKVIDFDGLLYAIDEVRAFDYARVKGVKIINASLGGYQASQSEYNAVTRLRDAGVLLVAAAGNDGVSNELDPVYPSAYPHQNVIAVAYSDQNDVLAPFSNYGATRVDLAAPGVEVLGPSPNNTYSTGSGSSFATPYVTGVAALLKAQSPGRNYSAIKSAILNGTDPKAALRGRTVTGGRLNAYEALIPRVSLGQALDANSLVWQTGGNRPWFGQTLDSSDGVDAARCGNIGEGHWSWIRTTVTGPGILWFDWRVSSEDDADLLLFSVGEELLSYISGESGWVEEAIILPAGKHTLLWAYDKDATVSLREDKAWLDRVLYVRDTSGPAITITSPVGTNLFATDATIEGAASDVLGVTRVEYRVINANGIGVWQAATSSDEFATWQAQLSNLALGTNLVRIRAFDTLNQVSSLNRTYTVLSPLTVNINGCGSVPARFAGATWQQAGKTLSIRATPCAGHLFTHWSGDRASSNAVLTFVMQPDLTLQANFVPNPFTPIAGAYHGLFHEAAGVLHESSGLLRMSLTATGLFSGVFVLDGATNKFSSRFDPVTGASTFAVPRAGKTPLQVSMQLDFAELITGQVGNGAWSADLIADRRVFSATNAPPFAGMYTLAFPGAVDFASSPGGWGFATATVDATGRVSIDGRLGDNARVLQTIPISRNGDWPFYAPLYAGSKGSVLGWMKFLSPPGFTNQLTSWIRPPLSTGTYYRSGFSNELSVTGSPYVTSPGVRVIDCTNALLILSGADFTEPITNQMTLTANNTVVNLGPYNISMNIVRTNGTFSGSIVLPTRTNTFRGAFLQQQNIGLGYFLGSSYIGEVRFEPGP